VHLALAAVVALIFGAAPTVGDVGSCGQTATALDARTFLAEKKALDCQRCQDCALTTQACTTACDPNAVSTTQFPSTCFPLQHDGDVCLRALQVASCDDYTSFMSDVSPTVPSECDFCHLVPEGGGIGEF
jgi:hypothetical protein